MERDQRVVTVPNLISVARLLCAPVFVWLLAEDRRVAAAVVLGVLGVTDWIDGWIARHFDQGSELGKVLDPVADRVLLVVAAVALLVDGAVPIAVGVLVLVRELVVSVAVLVLALAGARRIDVQWAGKAGTLSVMFAFPLFLLADSIDTGHDLVLAGAWFFAVVGLVLGYYAAITYLPVARAALQAGRAERDVPQQVAS
ncbi:MAG TPA: CDP-alcohol phosphatidyltransferase family protein [Acidimicrobiia bacterium]|nr:CDP-alcohol phosphatidyltransferase family protein [Acidimicrobiia bacterium]